MSMFNPVRIRLLCVCAFLWFAYAPRPASAQQRFAAQFADAPLPVMHFPAFMDQERVDQMDEEGRMTTSGFFLGIVGMLAGAAIGSGVGNAKCGDDCVSRSAAGGASIAGALMVPIGVHIAAVKPNASRCLSQHRLQQVHWSGVASTRSPAGPSHWRLSSQRRCRCGLLRASSGRRARWWWLQQIQRSTNLTTGLSSPFRSTAEIATSSAGCASLEAGTTNCLRAPGSTSLTHAVP